MKIKYNTKNKKNFRNKILITKNNYGEDGVGHIRIGLNSETVLGNMLDIEFNLPLKVSGIILLYLIIIN